MAKVEEAKSLEKKEAKLTKEELDFLYSICTLGAKEAPDTIRVSVQLLQILEKLK